MIKSFFDARIVTAAPTALQREASARLALARKAALSWKHTCPSDSEEQAMCDAACAEYELAKAAVAQAYNA